METNVSNKSVEQTVDVPPIIDTVEETESQRHTLEDHELDAINALVSQMHIPAAPQGLPEVVAVRRSSKAPEKKSSFSHDPEDNRGPSLKLAPTSLSATSTPLSGMSPMNSGKEKDTSLSATTTSTATAATTLTAASFERPNSKGSAKPKVTFDGTSTETTSTNSAAATGVPKRRSLSMLIKTNTMPVKQMSFLLKNNDDSKLGSDPGSFDRAKKKAIELAQDLAAQKDEQMKEMKLKLAQKMMDDEEKAKRGKATSYGFHSIKGGLTIHDFKESKRKSCCYDPVTNHSKISAPLEEEKLHQHHHHNHHKHLVPIESKQSLITIGKHLHLDTPPPGGAVVAHEPLMKIEEGVETDTPLPSHHNSRPATKHGSGDHGQRGSFTGAHGSFSAAHPEHAVAHHEHGVAHHDHIHGHGGAGSGGAHHHGPHHNHHLHHRLHEVISDQLIDQRFGWQRTLSQTSRNSQRNLNVDTGSGSLPPTVGKPRTHSLAAAQAAALAGPVPESPSKIPLLLTPLAAKPANDLGSSSRSPGTPSRRKSMGGKQKSLKKLHTDDAHSFAAQLSRHRSQVMNSFSLNADEGVPRTMSDDNLSLDGGSFIGSVTGDSLTASLASITSLNSLSQYKFLKVKVAKPVEDNEDSPSLMSEHIAKLDQTVLSHLDRAVYVDPGREVTWRDVSDQQSIADDNSIASILKPSELERQMNLRTGKLLNAYRPWSKKRSKSKEIDFEMIKEAFSRQPSSLKPDTSAIVSPLKSSLRRKSRKPTDRKPIARRPSLSRGNSAGSVGSNVSDGNRSRSTSAVNDLHITIAEEPPESGRISPTESVTSILTSSVNGMDPGFFVGSPSRITPSSRRNVMPIVINVVKVT